MTGLFFTIVYFSQVRKTDVTAGCLRLY